MGTSLMGMWATPACFPLGASKGFPVFEQESRQLTQGSCVHGVLRGGGDLERVRCQGECLLDDPPHKCALVPAWSRSSWVLCVHVLFLHHFSRVRTFYGTQAAVSRGLKPGHGTCGRLGW